MEILPGAFDLGQLKKGEVLPSPNLNFYLRVAFGLEPRLFYEASATTAPVMATHLNEGAGTGPSWVLCALCSLPGV